jgi:hypothetical protein
VAWLSVKGIRRRGMIPADMRVRSAATIKPMAATRSDAHSVQVYRYRLPDKPRFAELEPVARLEMCSLRRPELECPAAIRALVGKVGSRRSTQPTMGCSAQRNRGKSRWTPVRVGIVDVRPDAAFQQASRCRAIRSRAAASGVLRPRISSVSWRYWRSAQARLVERGTRKARTRPETLRQRAALDSFELDEAACHFANLANDG